MKAGAPDPEPLPAQPSLAARLAAAFRQDHPADWRIALAAGALIAAGPLLTIAGAKLLGDDAHAKAARLRAEAEPLIRTQRDAATARKAMTAALAQPLLGNSLDAIARALPAEASLMRAERTRDGGLELDVVAADPDSLRSALRRTRGFETLRDTSQRQGDGAMIVSFRQEP